MELVASSPPLISFQGELNQDCKIQDVFDQIKREYPTVIIRLSTDGIEIDGPCEAVLNAIELLFSQDVDVFRGNRYPKVEYLEEEGFDRKKIRHRAGKGKDKVFGEILARTSNLPGCYGSYAIRMITPTTLRKHMNATAQDLKKCKECKEAQTCCMSTQIRKLEELKWVRE